MDKILIVDDDRDFCLTLSRFLEGRGFSCSCATSGTNGLNLLGLGDYIAALVDFKLPDINGIDLLQKIKSLAPKTAVVIVTGYSDVRNAVKAIKQGAADYITKPLHPEEIISIIRRAVDDNEASALADTGERPAVIFEHAPHDLRESSMLAEKQVIMETLAKTGYNKTETAKLLHIDRKTLYNKFKAYNIQYKNAGT